LEDTHYVRMWPKSVLRKNFVAKKKRRESYPKYLENLELLDRPGVYVLYRTDESVYYIGRTIKPGVSLGERLMTHAKPNSRYSRWTHFSAFLIDESALRKGIERILISAVPTAKNGSRPMKPYKLSVQAYSRS
jgi:hypothetical protein